MAHHAASRGLYAADYSARGGVRRWAGDAAAACKHLQVASLPEGRGKLLRAHNRQLPVADLLDIVQNGLRKGRVITSYKLQVT